MHRAGPRAARWRSPLTRASSRPRRQSLGGLSSAAATAGQCPRRLVPGGLRVQPRGLVRAGVEQLADAYQGACTLGATGETVAPITPPGALLWPVSGPVT